MNQAKKRIRSEESKTLDLLFWVSERLNKNFWVAAREYERTRSKASFKRLLICKKALDNNSKAVTNLIQYMANPSKHKQ